jgi:hypothetical protein
MTVESFETLRDGLETLRAIVDAAIGAARRWITERRLSTNRAALGRRLAARLA